MTRKREEAEIRKGWSEHKQHSTKWKKVFSERNDMFLGKGRRLNKFPGDDLKEKKQSKCRDIWLDILSHHMWVCSFNYIKKLKHVLSWKVMHSCISMWTRSVAINILTKWHILSFLYVLQWGLQRIWNSTSWIMIMKQNNLIS